MNACTQLEITLFQELPTMPQPNQTIRGTQVPTANGATVQTMEELHPPVLAYSTTETAAVFGKSTRADGVHGESAAPTMSAVAGIHSAGGNGVYGSSSSGNAGFFQGSVQITGNLNVAGDIFLPGADLAEHFDIAPGASLFPGMLAALDETGALRPSVRPYDRTLAGVIAGAGSFRPAVLLDSASPNKPRVRLSLAGKAYCFADTSNGSIAVGDLLTSSATPGCAMRATDPNQSFGAVIGKALKPLTEGQELIPILVTLQ